VIYSYIRKEYVKEGGREEERKEMKRCVCVYPVSYDKSGRGMVLR